MSALTRRKTDFPAIVSAEVDDEGEAKLVYEMLAFQMEDERYAIPLRSVREILKVPPITGVPRAPHAVRGIISVRGKVTTVVDLRQRLSMSPAVDTKLTRVLLVDVGEEAIGILVDAVLQVFRLGQDEVELAAAVGGDTAEYVIGIGRPAVRTGGRGRTIGTTLDAQEDILILLDPEALLRR